MRPADAEHAGHHGHEQPGLGDRGELGEAGTVGEARGRLGRGAQREPGLADAARPGDRDQPGLGEQNAQPGELRLPPDEARCLDG